MPLEGVEVATDPARVIDDPEVQVVVETMGGTDPTLGVVLDALAAGKDVVTANKALLAEHGREVFAQARRSGRAVAFEASVGGGIPIVQALEVGLAANRITSLAAIVNGTCNFILTKMAQEGLLRATALKEAQVSLGFAEADPTLDVDGTDTAHKLAVLAQLAFGATVTTGQVPRQGIDRLQPADITYAGELGYAVKLLALAKGGAEGLELRVAPALVKRGTPLAEVRGPYNAVRVVGDAVGDTLFYGRGAGAMPTASAVVGDLIDVVVGRAGLTFRALDLWPADAPPARLASSSAIRSCWATIYGSRSSTVPRRPSPCWPRRSGRAGSASPRARDPATTPATTLPDGGRPARDHDPPGRRVGHRGGPGRDRRPGGRPPAERLPGRRGIADAMTPPGRRSPAIPSVAPRSRPGSR